MKNFIRKMSIWFSLQHWDVEPQIGEMLDYFGLEESEKVVILSVVTEETWKKRKAGMIVKMQIDVREPELHLSCHSAASAEKKHYIS